MATETLNKDRYGWIDFAHMEQDDDPERFYIEIYSTDDAGYYEDEVAVICHRLVGGKYPLDGDVAAQKRANAQMIVDALNTVARRTEVSKKTFDMIAAEQGWDDRAQNIVLRGYITGPNRDAATLDQHAQFIADIENGKIPV